jgi:PhzF family phenazine biosynthesis protein
MGIPIYHVDAFASEPFRGNPAAVCLLQEPQTDGWMQAVAREMNLSETAFLLPEDDGYRLRWFTPAVEVDLCGHATLASAHVLWETGRLGPDQVARFHTRSGLLTATLSEGWVELNFPTEPVKPVAAPEGLAEIVGVTPVFVGRNRFDYFLEVESEEIVRRAQPDFARLKRIPTRLAVVTSRASTAGYDFVSRCFGPQVGVDEDPVTGSAHCGLGTYWAGKLGRASLMAYQASARGGELRVRVAGERVIIGGQAVTVLEGQLVHGSGTAHHGGRP